MAKAVKVKPKLIYVSKVASLASSFQGFQSLKLNDLESTLSSSCNEASTLVADDHLCNVKNPLPHCRAIVCKRLSQSLTLTVQEAGLPTSLSEAEPQLTLQRVPGKCWARK